MASEPDPGFPTPSFDDWLERAGAELRGRSVGELTDRFDRGIPVPALATAEDAADLPHRRGDLVRALLPARGGWASREQIVVPRPDDAARQIRAALDGGIDQIEVCLDDAARGAREPARVRDEDFDTGLDVLAIEPGHGGVAVHCLDDLAAVLGPVDLAATFLSLRGGEAAVPALAGWLAIADRRGVPRAALHGEIDFEPFSRLLHRRVELGADDGEPGAHRTSHDHVYGEAAALMRYCAERCPGVRPLLVDGEDFHLLGADSTVELGYTIAAVVEHARQLASRGVGFAEFAAAVTIRVQVGHELLAEIAKLRALRLLWAKVARAFECREPHTAVTAVTTRRARADCFDHHTNLIRTALDAFAAIAGGCDHLVIVPCDADPDFQSEAARAIARDQHHVLRHEAHLHAVVDAAGGAHTIERLTHELAAGAWTVLQEVERGGGLLAQLRCGEVSARCAEIAASREDELARLRRALVGINRFAAPGLERPRELQPGVLEASTELQDAFDRWRAGRRSTAGGHLARLGVPPLDVDAAVDALAGDASFAEVATASWPPADEDHRLDGAHDALYRTDGEDFEGSRSHLSDLREEGGGVRVAVVAVGDRRRLGGRLQRAADVFTPFAVEPDRLGVFASVEEAVAATRTERCDLLVLCAADDDYPALIAALRRGPRSAPLPPLAAVTDEERELGVEHVISPDTNALEIAQALLENAGEDFDGDWEDDR